MKSKSTRPPTPLLQRPRLLLAWAAWIAVVGLLVIPMILKLLEGKIALFVIPVNPNPLLNLYDLAWQLIYTSVFVSLSFVVLVRKPKDGFAVATSATMLAFGVSTWATTATYGALVPSVLDFGIALARVLGALILCTFPNGRFQPIWVLLVVLAWSFWAFLGIWVPFLDLQQYPEWLFALVQFVFLGSGLIIQLYRYHRIYPPLQKQQAKWMIWGIFVVIVGYLIASLIGGIRLLPPFAVELAQKPLFYLSQIALGLAFTLSALRYRLWDIDFVINRSLIHGLLVLVLTIIFAVITHLFYWFVPVKYHPVGLGVGLIVAGLLFESIRSTLRRFVDERLYDIQFDYTKPILTSPAQMEWPEGSLMRETSFSDYQELELIDRGGVAIVYKAIHPKFSQKVAIKILPAERAADTEFLRRFEREARIVAQLRHINIVRLFDFGEESGTYYIVMEYIHGTTLNEVLAQKGRFRLAEAQSILTGIASALDYAHNHGLVHRDIKPANVMLEPKPDGNYRVVVMDFGIAKRVDGQTSLTESALLGTLDYISPEQIQSDPQIDRRADIYSMGILAYQMLTGVLPFQKKHMAALLMAHMQEPPPDPRDLNEAIPEHVALAIQRAMSKKRSDRYRTAGEFVTALLSH